MYMEREWKLGVDIDTYDNLLDGVTFDELIQTVHCNCREITPELVRREWEDIMDGRLADARFLLENNMDRIIAEASKGRT